MFEYNFMVFKKRHVMSVGRTFAIIGLVLLVFVKNINLKSLCPKDNYVIIDGKGRDQVCYKCHYCTEGHGLVPSCGTQITEAEKILIDCKPCISGRTFSDEYGPSSCKSCNICHAKENVSRYCTVDKNSICSNKCHTGYYFDNITTHECQPCSYCCNDGKDVKIEECKAHGMPESRQCSIQHVCTPVLNTNKPSLTSQVLTTAGAKSDLSTGQIAGIVVGSMSAGLLIFVCAPLVYCKCHRSSRSDQAEQLQRLAPPSSTRSDQEQQFSTSPPPTPLCQICLILRDETSNLTLSVLPPGDVIEGQDITIYSYIMEEVKEKALDFGKCEIRWTKDTTLLENENSRTLAIKDVKVLHFGSYECKLSCKHHQQDNQSASKCGQMYLDVRPREGKKYNLLINVCMSAPFNGDDMKLHLTLKNNGKWKWKEVAEFVGVKILMIKSWEEQRIDVAAKNTFEFLCSSTDKNVYEFLKFAKENNHFEMVNELFNDNDILCVDEFIAAKSNPTGPNKEPTSDKPECLTNGDEKKKMDRYERSVSSISYESSI